MFGFAGECADFAGGRVFQVLGCASCKQQFFIIFFVGTLKAGCSCRPQLHTLPHRGSWAQMNHQAEDKVAVLLCDSFMTCLWLKISGTLSQASMLLSCIGQPDLVLNVMGMLRPLELRLHG